ncbi:MAG: right-handed parallel beta-helix repeat-containing protein [Planctomycetaceae bacterium]
MRTDINCPDTTTGVVPSVIDVVILLDDTGSFTSAGLTLATVFPQIVTQLGMDLPAADFAFSVTRYEDYATDTPSTVESSDRPFILNQPLITTTTPNFSTAIDSALNRSSPGFGGDAPESGIEALWQIATGAGFDGNGNGSNLDGGVAGLVTTQISPGAGGDVPAFSSFTPDPTGPVLPPVGTGGGVGWRSNADQKIIIMATDITFQYEDDGQSVYTGVGGVTVPATDFTTGSRLDSPGGRGATIQATIDRLVADGIKVIGLGTGPASQRPLEALSTLTGAVDASGNPLYYTISATNASQISAGIIDGITSTVSNTAGAGDWRSLQFNELSNDRNVRTVLEDESANNDGVDTNGTTGSAQNLGELAKNLKSGDDTRPLGFDIRGFISADDSSDADVYSFQVDAGTEVWIDVDRTRGASVDLQLELVQQNGTVLATSTSDTGITGSAILPVGANLGPLTKNDYDGGDFYTTNYHDPGMRVVLPGAVGGNNETYYVRVRSEGGLTNGEYQLQIRLRQVDEKAGSIVEYADIRYATNGIEVNGLPYHSPLLAESSEVSGDNNSFDGGQQLGNLLESDRNTISFGGSLSSAQDVDFYNFSTDYATTVYGPSIQAIGGVNGGPKTWTTVFDLDYADGLTRADTNMVVWQEVGGQRVPILIGRESNIAADQPAAGNGIDLSDLSRGSAGELDPFIGPVQLPTGTPGTTTTYSVSVNSNQRQITQLNQTYIQNANNPDIRLEPVNSVERVVEDHIGYQGYDSNGAQIDPVLTDGLVDVLNLDTFVKSFDLSDVPLFVSSLSRLETANALHGEVTTDFGNLGNLNSNNALTDITFRSDGTLWGYRNTGNGTDASVGAGQLVQINPGTGAFIPVGSDNIPGSVSTPVSITPGGQGSRPLFDELTFTGQVDALAWERSGGVNSNANYVLYYSVQENGIDATGTASVSSKLYRANPDTGSAARDYGNGYGAMGDLQPAGVTYASGNIFVRDNSGDRSFGLVFVEARAPGLAGNGIQIIVTRNDAATQVTNVAGNVITVNVDSNPNGTAQQLVDAINSNANARALVTAAVTGGGSGEAGASITGNTILSGGLDGTTFGPLLGNVSGLSFGDFYGDANVGASQNGNGVDNTRLYGVTEAGEFIRINTANGLVENLVDLTPILPAGATGFSGLTLGPQNLGGGSLSDILFATTNNGQVIALDPTAFVAATTRTDNDPFGFVVNAFDSGNAQQELTVTGPVNPNNTFTLTFDDGFGNLQTTDLISVSAPAVNSLNETQTVTVTGTTGSFALSFVDSVPAVTALSTDVIAGATTLTVQDAADFPLTNFLVSIESELVQVVSRAGNTLALAAPLAANHDITDSVIQVKQTTNAALSFPGATTLTVANAYALTGATRLRIGTEIVDVATVDVLTNTVTLVSGTTQFHNLGETISRIQTTAQIPYSSTPAVVQAALEALPGIGAGNVLVTQTVANVYDVEFTGLLKSTDVQPLIGDTTQLQRNEIQQINPARTPDAGTFTITVPANVLGPASTTAAIPFNASAAQVEAALELLPNVNDVIVTSTGGFGSFSIEFVDPGSQNLALVTMNPTGLSAPANEVNTLTLGGNATGGAFALTLTTSLGTFIAGIPFNATANAIRNAIVAAAPPLSNADITVTGGGTVNTSTMTITFQGVLAGEDVTLTGNAGSLTGTAPTVDIVETVVGGTPLALTIADGIETTLVNGAASTIGVVTTQNGIISIEEALENLPAITDVLVTGGDLPGTPVQILFQGTLAGLDVLPLVANNSLMVGGELADVTVIGTAGDGLPDTFVQSLGTTGTTSGLAFSPLDFNLWHPTTNRGADTGHGINDAYDFSRTPSGADVSLTDGFGNGYATNQSQGGASLYFGLEKFQTGTTPYFNYDSSNGQYGVQFSDFQRDLTSGTIGSTATASGDYDLPGGALGTVITNTFDLTSRTLDAANEADRPVLYFNYFLDSENRNTSSPDGTMRDSARVFISTDDGLTWELLATNNTPGATTGTVGSNASTEVPDFISHIYNAGPSDAKQQIQPLFDVADWRQARVDLSRYSGMAGLRLRFDFSTAGTIVDLVSAGGEDTGNEPAISNSTNSPELATDVDDYGNLNDTARGQNNNFEGFYVDDIIIGWAERGEMITAATNNAAFTTVPQDPPDPMNPMEVLVGQYQVEIRRGYEYASLVDSLNPDITISSVFDPNTEFVSGADLGLTAAIDDFETGDFSKLGWRSTDGEKPFVVQDVTGLILGRANVAAAGMLNQVEHAELSVTVNTGAGELVFDQFFSPDGTGFDTFEILVGGTGETAPLYSYTGTDTGFKTIRIPVEAGTQTFTFIYRKAAGGIDGTGFLLLDNIAFPAPGGGIIRGDRNLEREQGHFQIQNNTIRDSAENGIIVSAGNRDPLTGFALPGSPINFETPNSNRFAPGIAIVNNVIVRSGQSGIQFGGDPVTGTGNPLGAVPLGKIVNNTIYGGETAGAGTIGINVVNNAAPTILNNIIVNEGTGIRVDATSQQTIVARTYFRGNNTKLNAGGVTSQSEVPDIPSNPLFVNPLTDNFYLVGDSQAGDGIFDGAVPIDRSIKTIPDRAAFTAVKSDLGIPDSDVVSPGFDIFRQTRVDDPEQPPSGVGSEVFNDVGAIERADFIGPYGTLLLPLDNGPDDLNALDHDVVRIEENFLTRLIIKLNDDGSGIDDTFVRSGQWQLRKDGVLLREGVDYTFIWVPGLDQVIFQALSSFPTDSVYTITVVDRDPTTTIRDRAGNPIQSNRSNGDIRFEVILDNGVNDAPVNTVPAMAMTDEDTELVFDSAGGNPISVDDTDAYLGTNELTVTLFAEHGTLNLPAGITTDATGQVVTLPAAATLIGQSFRITDSRDPLNPLATRFTFVDAAVVAAPTSTQIAINLTDSSTAVATAVTSVLNVAYGAASAVSAADVMTLAAGLTSDRLLISTSNIAVTGSNAMTVLDGASVIGEQFTVGIVTFSFVDIAVWDSSTAALTPNPNQIAVAKADSPAAVAAATALAINDPQLYMAGAASSAGAVVQLAGAGLYFSNTDGTSLKVSGQDITVPAAAQAISEEINIDGTVYRFVDAAGTVGTNEIAVNALGTANDVAAALLARLNLDLGPLQARRSGAKITLVAPHTAALVRPLVLSGATLTVPAGSVAIGDHISVGRTAFSYVDANLVTTPAATEIPVDPADPDTAVAAATQLVLDTYFGTGTASVAGNVVTVNNVVVAGVTPPTGQAVITITGDITLVNQTLNGLGFLPTQDYFGPASLLVLTEDLGQFTQDPARQINMTDVDIIPITVKPINDPPLIDAVADQTIIEDEDLNPADSVIDEHFVGLTGIEAGPINELEDMVVTVRLAATTNVAVSNGSRVIGTSLTVDGTVYTYVDLALTPVPGAGQIGVNITDDTIAVAQATAASINAARGDNVARAAANFVSFNLDISLVTGPATEFHIADQDALIADLQVDYTSVDTFGTVRYTPHVDAFGMVDVIVRVTDAGLDNVFEMQMTRSRKPCSRSRFCRSTTTQP